MKPGLFSRPICLLTALLCAFCGKPETVAGGYDDVENPALTVSLRDTLGRPYAAAEIHLYARYQNPGKDSVPMYVRNAPAAKTIAIRDSLILAAMAGSKLLGTPWPSQDTVEFNLVASDPAGETFLGDFQLLKGSNGAFRFQRRLPGSVVYPNSMGTLAVTPTMAGPVLNQRGRIGVRGLELKLKNVFIAGSPYRASIGGDGSFAFARLAPGRYDVKAVSEDAKIYTAADSLITGIEYLPADWSEADLIWVE
ncbi:MAG: hypothetical protein ABIW76_06175 [Fibrobacteria bacterium]